jgi:hypothetical protein
MCSSGTHFTPGCQRCLPCHSHTFLPAFSFGTAPPTSAAPAATAASKVAAYAIALEVIQDRLVVSAPLDDAIVEQLIDLLPPTLQHLEMPRASMTVMPESVGKFAALEALHLKDCWKLAALPESVGNLGALRTLDLSYCDKLTALPESVGNLGALLTLNLFGCTKLTALPESVGNLGALHMLCLAGCRRLKTLPASISQLLQLDEASRKQVKAILRGAPTAL